MSPSLPLGQMAITLTQSTICKKGKESGLSWFISWAQGKNESNFPGQNALISEQNKDLINKEDGEKCYQSC
jgi:hypothetical protein